MLCLQKRMKTSSCNAFANDDGTKTRNGIGASVIYARESSRCKPASTNHANESACGRAESNCHLPASNCCIDVFINYNNNFKRYDACFENKGVHQACAAMNQQSKAIHQACARLRQQTGHMNQLVAGRRQQKTAINQLDAGPHQ